MLILYFYIFSHLHLVLWPSLMKYSLNQSSPDRDTCSSVVEHLSSYAGVPGLNSQSSHTFSLVWYVYFIVYSSIPLIPTIVLIEFLYRYWQYLESIHKHVIFMIRCIYMYFNNISMLALKILLITCTTIIEEYLHRYFHYISFLLSCSSDSYL